MFKKLFKKQKKKTFTYFVPSAKVHGTFYREKNLDSITQLFESHDIDYSIDRTIPHNYGFWIIFNLIADDKRFHLLESDQQYLPHTLNSESDRDFELISENDDEFNDYDNFQV